MGSRRSAIARPRAVFARAAAQKPGATMMGRVVCVLALCTIALSHTVRYAPFTTLTGDATPFPFPLHVTNGTAEAAASVDIERLSRSARRLSMNSAILRRGVARYLVLMQTSSRQAPVPCKPTSTIATIDIEVQDTSETLSPETDYSYSLSVTKTRVAIAAKSVFGALYALESFSQLVEREGAQRVVRAVPWHIEDAPRFAHRGVLIDSARHFLPKRDILAHLDAMSYNKLNVLHWHIVDAQSFPLILPSLPELSRGAYAPDERYTPEDVEEVVSYARDRGIRVVVEIDTPGHTASWRVGRPNIITACPQHSANINNPPLDPSQEETFHVVRTVLRDVARMFPDSYVHLGGDEVDFACWNESQRVVEFMAKKGFGSDFGQLYQYYVDRLLKIAREELAGRTLVLWQDVRDDGVAVSPRDAVLFVWRASPDWHKEVQNMVTSGFRVLVSDDDKCAGYSLRRMLARAYGCVGDSSAETIHPVLWRRYLNIGFTEGAQYVAWEDVYNNDPLANLTLSHEEEQITKVIRYLPICQDCKPDGALAAAEENEMCSMRFFLAACHILQRVLGGEACLWGEQIAAQNIQEKAWPRTSAFAERMWSSGEFRSDAALQPRLVAHRCRLVARGVRASPIDPGTCSRW